MKLGISVVL